MNKWPQHSPPTAKEKPADFTPVLCCDPEATPDISAYSPLVRTGHMTSPQQLGRPVSCCSRKRNLTQNLVTLSLSQWGNAKAAGSSQPEAIGGCGSSKGGRQERNSKAMEHKKIPLILHPMYLVFVETGGCTLVLA